MSGGVGAASRATAAPPAAKAEPATTGDADTGAFPQMLDHAGAPPVNGRRTNDRSDAVRDTHRHGAQHDDHQDDKNDDGTSPSANGPQAVLALIALAQGKSQADTTDTQTGRDPGLIAATTSNKELPGRAQTLSDATADTDTTTTAAAAKSAGSGDESTAVFRQTLAALTGAGTQGRAANDGASLLGGSDSVTSGAGGASASAGSHPTAAAASTTAFSAFTAALKAATATGGHDGLAAAPAVNRHDPRTDGSPALAPVGAATAIPTTTALPSVTRNIMLPVDHPQWAHAVAEAVVEAAGPDGGRLRLQLHPADLGPVDIALDIQRDRAKVQISALHDTTRTALQAAIPQLTALLAGEGLQLTHADVGSQQQSAPQQAPVVMPTPAGDGLRTSAGRVDTVRHLLLRNGLIDDYA